MSEQNVMFALDKILVLSHMKIRITWDCPYFDMGIDQLTAELKRPENKEETLRQLNRDTTLLEAMQDSRKIYDTLK